MVSIQKKIMQKTPHAHKLLLGCISVSPGLIWGGAGIHSGRLDFTTMILVQEKIADYEEILGN